MTDHTAFFFLVLRGAVFIPTSGGGVRDFCLLGGRDQRINTILFLFYYGLLYFSLFLRKRCLVGLDWMSHSCDSPAPPPSPIFLTQSMARAPKINK